MSAPVSAAMSSSSSASSSPPSNSYPKGSHASLPRQISRRSESPRLSSSPKSVSSSSSSSPRVEEIHTISSACAGIKEMLHRHEDQYLAQLQNEWILIQYFAQEVGQDEQNWKNQFVGLVNARAAFERLILQKQQVQSRLMLRIVISLERNERDAMAAELLNTPEGKEFVRQMHSVQKSARERIRSLCQKYDTEFRHKTIIPWSWLMNGANFNPSEEWIHNQFVQAIYAPYERELEKLSENKKDELVDEIATQTDRAILTSLTGTSFKHAYNRKIWSFFLKNAPFSDPKEKKLRVIGELHSLKLFCDEVFSSSKDDLLEQFRAKVVRMHTILQEYPEKPAIFTHIQRILEERLPFLL